MTTIKNTATLAFVCALALFGCSGGPDDPGTATNTSILCTTATGPNGGGSCTTSTLTSTDAGNTATKADTGTTVTTTDTNTTTDAGPVWPAYCNGDSTAADLGSGVLMTGLWNVTCGTTAWNLYITVSSKGGKTAGGYAFLTADINLPDPVPSLTEYKGVATSNCLWLNPTAMNPSLATVPALPLKGTAVNWTDQNLKQVTGGPCTMEWRKEYQCGNPGVVCSPHYWEGAGTGK